MGVADWFQTFCDNLKIQDKGTISLRYKAITTRLNSDFRNLNSETSYSLYVGSYGRNTAINSISDVDMLYQLPYEIYEKYNAYQTNGQSALLQSVRDSLKKTYSSSSLRGDGQVVVINFTDNISFDILPSFINTDGSYTYPDSNNGGSWKTTDPKAEINAIKERNSECNFNLVPLCRIMRCWKDCWKVPIKGLLIDTLAYQFINTWQYKDKSYLYYDYMSRDFFLYMSSLPITQGYWKAPGSGRFVYGGDLFQYKAKQCYNLACEAIAYETSDPKKEWSAKNTWRKIFGTKFPE